MQIRGMYIDKGMAECLDYNQQEVIEKVEKAMNEKGMSNKDAMEYVYRYSMKGWLVWCWISLNYHYVPQKH